MPKIRFNIEFLLKHDINYTQDIEKCIKCLIDRKERISKIRIKKTLRCNNIIVNNKEIELILKQFVSRGLLKERGESTPYLPKYYI